MNAPAILIVPACGKGFGGGHLSRSMFLLRKLNECGRKAFLWIDESQKKDALERFAELLSVYSGEASQIISGRQDLSGHTWSFIVLDNFKTSALRYDFWRSLSVPLIGIDEGGPCREKFDFLIDLLPSVSGHKPNLCAPRLLPLPKKRRPPDRAMPDTEVAARPLRILVSFGAEDSAGLGEASARALSACSALHEVTFVAPNCDKINKAELPGVRITGLIPDFKEHLAEYDLFITHFGLGAFEALYAGVPALLLSPTAYHEKLGRKAGFVTLKHKNLEKQFSGIFTTNTHLWCCHEPTRKAARRYGLAEDQKEDIAVYINRLSPCVPANCPVCGEKISGKILARFPDETYRICLKCGVICLSRLNAPPVEYRKEYFHDLYKKQYGKTYIEDFPNLTGMGRRRLSHIKGILESDSAEAPSLLDIGCAYGPFLAAAAEEGFVPEGIEPVEEAAQYVKKELGFNCRHGFFSEGPGEEPQPPSGAREGAFDVISLWYVIEHFQKPGDVLKEINRLLKDGGVLAFSTPSCRGVSGRKSLCAFLENSPGDHWTVWSPGVCKKIFAMYGFELRKIVVTGHHPERFPLLGRFLRPEKKGPLYRLLFFASRLFRLGDTFEAYGIKKRATSCS